MKEWISLIFQFWGVPPFLYGWSYQVYYEIWILIIYPRSESIEGSLHRLYILTHIFPRHLACWGPGYINLPQKGWWHRHHSTDDILPKFTYTFYCNPRGGWSPSKPMEFLNIASRKSQNLLMLMQGSVYLFWVALLKPAGLEKCWRKTGLFLDYLFIYSESCSKKDLQKDPHVSLICPPVNISKPAATVKTIPSDDFSLRCFVNKFAHTIGNQSLSLGFYGVIHFVGSQKDPHHLFGSRFRILAKRMRFTLPWEALIVWIMSFQSLPLVFWGVL